VAAIILLLAASFPSAAAASTALARTPETSIAATSSGSSEVARNLAAAPPNGEFLVSGYAPGHYAEGTHIFTINSDGTGLHQLTFGAAFDQDPVWSPDQTTIAYQRRPLTNYQGQIWLMNADGSAQHVVAPGTEFVWNMAPAWSPNGAQISYKQAERGGPDEAFRFSNIVVMDADGTNAYYLVQGDRPSAPVWSPSGSKIAFWNTVQYGTPGLHTIDPVGTNDVNLYPNTDLHPEDWSPDGQTIIALATSAEDLTVNLFKVSSNGGSSTQFLAASPLLGDLFRARYAPDGSKIAYAYWSNQDLGCDIYVINADGSGTPENITGGISTCVTISDWAPATTPGAPTAVGATPGNTSALVVWAAPVSNGGSPITGYTVTSSAGGQTCTTGGTLSCIVTGLTNGIAYTFTVTATNAAGTGPASAASAPVTPGPFPDPPTGVSATAAGSSAQVTWVAPVSDGGSPITGYTATASPGGKTCTTSGALFCTVTGMADGLYTFTVIATNGTGSSLPSAPSSALRIDTIKPSASAPAASLVTNSTIASTTVPVRLAWSGSDAGSGIDHFELAFSTNGGAYVALTEPTPTSTSLTRSFAPSTTRTYRFRVRALDHSGNASAWLYGPTFHVKLIQQSSTAVHYAGTWATGTSTSATGGSYKSTHSTGASATYTFTGRMIAMVAYKASNVGSVKIYVDGVYRATVSLYASTTAWRRIVYVRGWTSSGTHTIKIVCAGTAGHPRIDLDAYVVLG
jgi:hypothetical protein